MIRPALSALCLLMAACTDQPPTTPPSPIKPSPANSAQGTAARPAAASPAPKTPAPTASAAASKPPETEARKHKPVGMNDRGEVSSIGLEPFFALHQAGKAMVFDARPSFIHKLGHIPGAINLPKENCDTTIAAMEPSIRSALASGKTIVVYCSGFTCPDARTVARHFSGFGYPATIFSGGWSSWTEASLPTE